MYADEFLSLSPIFPDNLSVWELKSKEEASDLPGSMVLLLMMWWNALQILSFHFISVG